MGAVGTRMEAIPLARALGYLSRHEGRWVYFKGHAGPVLLLRAGPRFSAGLALSGRALFCIHNVNFQGIAPIAEEASGSITYGGGAFRPTWTRIAGRQFQEGVDW